MIDPQRPKAGDTRSKSSQFVGATSNMSIIGTQQERRHHLVHCDAADVATNHITPDSHLKLIRKMGNRQNKKKPAVGCEYMRIKVNGRQLTV